MAAVRLSEQQCNKFVGFLHSCGGIYVGNESRMLRFVTAIL
jgi:hypothetical protein